MIENWHNAFEHVIKSEGGYVNDPHDHGGETNLGVTKKAWAEFIGREVHDGEMKALTKATVEPFYKKGYWDKCRCDDLPVGLDYAVFDFAVNSGPGRAAKFLQQAVGVVADGAIGPGTLAAVAKCDPKYALDQFSAAKEHFYKGLVEKDPTQKRFINGWLNRVEEVEKTATTMFA
jgi:lysozyme family protein